MAQRPSVTIAKRHHATADKFLMQEHWKHRHGYIGLPSRKTFTFETVEDRAEFLKYLDSRKVPYDTDIL